MIRNHYKALWRASDLTQDEVARRGGLPGQNAISNLLANTHKGPTVETLAKAIHGLGLSLEEFFASLEDRRPGAQSLGARIDAIELALATLHDKTAALAAQQRRGHDATATDDVVFPPTGQTGDTLDPRIVALVHATLDPLIDSLTAKVDAAVSARRNADLDAARNLSDRRGSLRRPARPPRPPYLKETLKEEVS
jgi:transcriptional regulator with XRE-family HTH domain